jgi:hypothetical protein
MNERYTIEHVSDFLKVPEDRLDACLSDFKEALSCSRLFQATTLLFGEPPLEKFTWIDDGKTDATIDIHFVKENGKCPT